MKKLNKTIILLVCLFAINIANAQIPQPPKPPHQPSHGQGNDNNSANNTPVGTATALLFTLSVGYAAYKIKTNSKQQNEKKNNK